jgi:hypothetical protein
LQKKSAEKRRLGSGLIQLFQGDAGPAATLGKSSQEIKYTKGKGKGVAETTSKSPGHPNRPETKTKSGGKGMRRRGNVYICVLTTQFTRRLVNYGEQGSTLDPKPGKPDVWPLQ